MYQGTCARCRVCTSVLCVNLSLRVFEAHS